MTEHDTPEEELIGTLEQIQKSGKAPCRLCGHKVDVEDATNWGDVFEALAEHGEREHMWDPEWGWEA